MGQRLSGSFGRVGNGENGSGRVGESLRVCVFGGFSLCYAGLLALIMSQKYNVIYC